MSYIDELRQARGKTQTAYTNFMLHTREGKHGLFCFFEGKDHHYYVPRIKQFTNNYHIIKCGGRERVLEVYNLIDHHSEYNKYKKAFFIDRDFNEPLPSHNPPVFETPCYSIENLYVSMDVFKEILKNHLHLSEIDPDYVVCLELFIAKQAEFHRATILFNAWYACLITIRNETGQSTGVNLADKLPRQFIEFGLEAISANYNLEKIKQTFPDATSIPDEVLEAKMAEFTGCEPHYVFRGKYELAFVITMLEYILQDSKNAQKYINRKIKFTFSDRLNNQQAITLFSDCAETPESLKTYLRQVIAED